MRELNVLLPCGKELRFFMSEENQRVHCTNHRVLTILSDRGVLHFNGSRYFPEDGEAFLEALHDFYWLKGLLLEIF